MPETKEQRVARLIQQRDVLQKNLDSGKRLLQLISKNYGLERDANVRAYINEKGPAALSAISAGLRVMNLAAEKLKSEPHEFWSTEYARHDNYDEVIPSHIEHSRMAVTNFIDRFLQAAKHKFMEHDIRGDLAAIETFIKNLDNAGVVGKDFTRDLAEAQAAVEGYQKTGDKLVYAQQRLDDLQRTTHQQQHTMTGHSSEIQKLTLAKEAAEKEAGKVPKLESTVEELRSQLAASKKELATVRGELTRLQQQEKAKTQDKGSPAEIALIKAIMQLNGLARNDQKLQEYCASQIRQISSGHYDAEKIKQEVKILVGVTTAVNTVSDAVAGRWILFASSGKEKSQAIQTAFSGLDIEHRLKLLNVKQNVTSEKASEEFPAMNNFLKALDKKRLFSGETQSFTTFKKEIDKVQKNTSLVGPRHEL